MVRHSNGVSGHWRTEHQLGFNHRAGNISRTLGKWEICLENPISFLPAAVSSRQNRLRRQKSKNC